MSLLGQLYWREHFYLIAAVTPQYGTMHGNPMCRIIDWYDGAARACLGARERRLFLELWLDFARRCQG